MSAAQWEALAGVAAGWCGFGACAREEPDDDEEAAHEAFHRQRGEVLSTLKEYAGLALFARLMVIVTREDR